MKIITNEIEMDIFREVIIGLQANPKYISSKFFYDDFGSKLFQQIMAMPEYYLTRTEFQILDNYKNDILREFTKGRVNFNLIEFGAGDGIKTKILIEHFLHSQAIFQYIPIDISQEPLNILTENLKKQFPSLNVRPYNREYLSAINIIKNQSNSRNIILFLGSNIGNFNDGQAIEFLLHIRNKLNTGDMILIGFDLKKSPKIILDAYNDSQGITSAFNLNLLTRFNREIGSNFDLNKFIHYPTYNPVSGKARSFLISLENQKIKFPDYPHEVIFDKYEPIFTEVSMKYSTEKIINYSQSTGFSIINNFKDENNYFTDSLWQAI